MVGEWEKYLGILVGIYIYIFVNLKLLIGSKVKSLPEVVFFDINVNVYFSTRQEAAGALWNLSFDDRNREAIAAAGGVEALV